jgi:hypothetical protein
MTRGLDMCVLDDVNEWSFAGFGWESFGCYLWDLSLGQHTGTGRFDGEVFLDGWVVTI